MSTFLTALLMTVVLVSARPRDVRQNKRTSIAIPMPETPCDETRLTDMSGFLSTPNYPYPYNYSQTCNYTIQPDIATEFSVYFHACDCEIEQDYGYQCYDYFEMDGLRFCGNLTGMSTTVNSTGGSVDIIFKSDFIIREHGCNIIYEVNSDGSGLAARCPPTPERTTSAYTTPVYYY